MTNLKIDRTELDAAIKSLEGMFQATEKVLADYEKEKQSLEKRGQDLDKKLAELQQSYTECMLQREEETNTSKYIKLSKQLTEIQDEMKIITLLKEQLKSDFQALKEKYVESIRQTYSKDLSVKQEFDVNQTVEYVRYELTKAIADYASAVRSQDAKVMAYLYDEFLSDSQLVENNPVLRREFTHDRYKLSYSSMMPNVLTRNNVHLACGGNIDPEIRKPKGAE